MNTNTPVISLATIREWKPCREDYDTIERLYPTGVPLTLEAAHHLHEQGVDVLWGALQLISNEDRVEFLLFTLRQRQPDLIALLRDAGLEDHANELSALQLDTGEDADLAARILAAARWTKQVPKAAATRIRAREAEDVARRAAANIGEWNDVWEAGWFTSSAIMYAVSWKTAPDPTDVATSAEEREQRWKTAREAGHAAEEAAIKEQIRWVYERLTISIRQP